MLFQFRYFAWQTFRSLHYYLLRYLDTQIFFQSIYFANVSLFSQYDQKGKNLDATNSRSVSNISIDDVSFFQLLNTEQESSKQKCQMQSTESVWSLIYNNTYSQVRRRNAIRTSLTCSVGTVSVPLYEAVMFNIFTVACNDTFVMYAIYFNPIRYFPTP